MFSFRVWTFLRGALRLALTGGRPEQLVNDAVRAGIPVWGVRQRSDGRWELRLPADCLGALRPVARASGCRVRILDRSGLPFALDQLEAFRGAWWGLFAGALIGWALLSLIWVVDVRGVRHLPPEMVLAEAAGLGVKPGALRARLRPERLEPQLTLRLPRATFVSVRFEGVRVIVEVVEKLAPLELPLGPAHLVARWPGLVSQVLVLDGVAGVRPGDTVAVGDTVIYGTDAVVANPGQPGRTEVAPPIPGQPATKLARGRVLARSWFQSYWDVPRRATRLEPTGRTYRRTALKLGQMVILIGGRAAVPFSDYVVRETRSGGRNRSSAIEVLTTTFVEMRKVTVGLDVPSAVEWARRMALERVREAIGTDGRVLSVESAILDERDDGVGISVNIEAEFDVAGLATGGTIR